MNKITRIRQLNKKGKRTSDAGYSLIEVLIAVTILAIIAAPLLHMFLTSTRINVKARQKFNATTVAQNIMEGLKAYTLEEVIVQFKPLKGVNGNTYHDPSDGFYVINSSLIQGGVQDLTERMAGHEEGDGVYYFGIENLKMQGGEYDALIKLDASTYGEDKGATDAPHDNVFNGKFYAEIGSVEETGDGTAEATDGSYHQDKELDAYVLQDVKQQITAGGGGTTTDDLDDLELEDIITGRTISITMKEAQFKDAKGNGQCEAKITFTYTCKYQGTEYTSYGYAGSAGAEVKGITRTFSGGNFYLFYYPFYSSKTIDSIEFHIQDEDKLLDEENPLLKGIVVAKQIRSKVDISNNSIVPELPLTGPGSLWEKEASYMVEKVDVTPNSPLTENLSFKTNLYTNLADGSEIDDPVGHYDNFYISPHPLVGENTGDKVTNVIYDIEIVVYETGAAKHFTENNFENNDEVHRLATITNLNQ